MIGGTLLAGLMLLPVILLLVLRGRCGDGSVGLDPDDQSVPVITSSDGSRRGDRAAVASMVAAGSAAGLRRLVRPATPGDTSAAAQGRRSSVSATAIESMATPTNTRLVPRRARRVYRTLRGERRTLAAGRGRPRLSTAAGFVAGLILGSITGTLELLPGLLVLIPASVGMRGMIFGAMGARLGTGIAAGRVRTEPTPQRPARAQRRGGRSSRPCSRRSTSPPWRSSSRRAFGEDTVLVLGSRHDLRRRRGARLGRDPGGHRGPGRAVLPAGMGPRRRVDPDGHGDRRHDHAPGPLPRDVHRAQRLSERGRRGAVHGGRDRRARLGGLPQLPRGAAHRCSRWRA